MQRFPREVEALPCYEARRAEQTPEPPRVAGLTKVFGLIAIFMQGGIIRRIAQSGN